MTVQSETTLAYRKQRIDTLANEWRMSKCGDLYVSWEPAARSWVTLKNAIKAYVSRALHFEYTDDDVRFMAFVDRRRDDRANVTPNGAVVPKCEYALEYNLFLKSWCDVVKEMIGPNPGMLKRFRLTPNIRIKFGTELEDNVGRGLDTAIPHSDAWVEGPWGMNCHVPVIGDTDRNYLKFYKLIDDQAFQDEFLELSAEYTDMQWVLSHYSEDDIVPKCGTINVSDYALVHNTCRLPGAGTRISIDTTIFVGDHPLQADREVEYLDHIPSIGDDLYVAVDISENDSPHVKKSVFSNYTTGTLRRICLR